MEWKTVKLACFSPTGTTKAVLRGIARGLGAADAELIDITRPRVRDEALSVAGDELLVVGVPVYMGRIPALLGPWLDALRAEGAPVVCVVVYGNRAYENALLEFTDRIVERGGVLAACGAFVGEHSFSDAGTPTAQGRPDRSDLELAEAFGREVREKLRAAASPAGLAAVEVPGTRPYGGRTEVWSVDFIAVNDDCIQCGACAELCPVEAIDPRDSRVIDQETCITCCACIKLCPQQARSIKPGPVRDAQLRLHANCAAPKRPETFL